MSDPAQSKFHPGWFVVSLGVVVVWPAFLWWTLSGGRTKTVFAALVLGVVLGLVELFAERRKARSGESPMDWSRVLAGPLTFAPALVALFLLAIRSPWGILAMIVVAAAAVFGWLQDRTTAKITELVSAPSSEADRKAEAPEPDGEALTSAGAATIEAPPGGSLIPLRVTTSEDLPDCSDSLRERLQRRSARTEQVARVRERSLFLFILCTAGLPAVIALVLGVPTPVHLAVDGNEGAASFWLPWPTLALAALFFVLRYRMLSRWFPAALRLLFVPFELAARPIEALGPRQPAHALVADAWILITLARIPIYADEGPDGVRTLAAIALTAALPAVWLLLRNRRLAAIEAALPVEPPRVLVFLRVFLSPRFKGLSERLGDWNTVGAVRLLDGPDTAGRSLSEVANYLTGRLHRSIVEDDRELEAEWRGFTPRPRFDLSYPVDSMQCTDATWTAALDRLLDDADVVAMDLAEFTEERRGCAYEIGQLLDRIPLRRVLLFVDESTDVEFLRRVLSELWRELSPDSPNREADPEDLTIIDVSRISEEQIEQQAADKTPDWVYSLAGQPRHGLEHIDNIKLAALMLERAETVTEHRDRYRDLVGDSWIRKFARRPFPPWLGRLRWAAWLVLLAVMAKNTATAL